MAKKLISHYTFDPVNQTVVIDGIYRLERILLITNVTKNETLYTFNDSIDGLGSYSIDTEEETTTIVLEKDCTQYSITDKLQIFVEYDTVSFAPSETYVDPVSKIRVSQPENLIDTDFEYGLQSTKWETLELVRNIPTFFSRTGDSTLDVTSMTTIENSDIVTVITSSAHNFQPGSPIIVKGTKTISADGTFVVTAIPTTTTFQYKCKAEQTSTRSILDTYTEVFSGSVYQGTEFDVSGIDAITTSGDANSILTVNTVFPTGFTNGTSFFLSNSLGSVNVPFDATAVQPDLGVIIDQTRGNTIATGETGFTLGSAQPYDYTGSEVLYFRNNDITINTASETITFPYNHDLIDNVPYLYIPGELNGTIGGLSAYVGYYVRVISPTQIYLTTTKSGTARVNLTGNGSDGSVMRSAFIRGWRMYTANTTTEEVYFYENVTNNNFTQATPVMFFNGSAPNMTVSSNLLNAYTLYYPNLIGTANGADKMTFSTLSGGAVVNLTTATANAIMIQARLLAEADTLYFPQHGLIADTPILFTVTAGSAPGGLGSGTTYLADPVGSDRVRFKITTGGVVNLTSAGATNSSYRIQAKQINPYADAFYAPDNNLSDGSRVTYSNEGGTTIGGLVNGSDYYVFQKSTNYIKLASTSDGWSAPAIIIPSQSSATYVNVASDYIQSITHNLNTGDIVQYLGSPPIPGLVNGAFYYVRVINTTTFRLFTNLADANSNTNWIDIVNVGTNVVGTFRASSLKDITSVGTGTQKLTVTSANAADGVYSKVGTVSDTTFEVTAGTEIPIRTINFVSNSLLNITENAFYVPGHGFKAGAALLYTNVSGTALSPMTDGTTYYVQPVSKNWFRLCASSEASLTGGAFLVFSTQATGTERLSTPSISGQVPAAGTVSGTAGEHIITGTNTNFQAVFAKGDSIFVYGPEVIDAAVTSASQNIATNVFTTTAQTWSSGDAVIMTAATPPGGTFSGYIYYVNPLSTTTHTLHVTRADALANANIVDVTTTVAGVTFQRISGIGSLTQYTIRRVNSFYEIETEQPISTTMVGWQYALGTALLIRADGSAVHRPYDGGVELTPSTNPDSQMIRQTRKYFRYQSGKGIQVSFAVNFSPTVTIDTMQVQFDTYKVEKCERDIGYIIDGLQYDVGLGTNYNSRFLGIAELNSVDLSQVVVDTIDSVYADAAALSNVIADPTSATAVNNFFNEIQLLISTRDRNQVSALTFTNPVGVSVYRTNAKTRLLNNLTFIEAEVNAWVEDNYPAHDHSVTKCTRDVKYAVWALCYDILYSCNQATYDQAKFFLYFAADGSNGIAREHIEQTVSAYNRLATIVSDIVLGNVVTPSSTNTEVQNTSGSNADAAIAAELVTLVNITRDTIDNAAVPAVTKVYPVYTWNGAGAVAAADQIAASKTTLIADNVTNNQEVAYRSAFITTRVPHRLSVGVSIKVFGAELVGGIDIYNGNFIVSHVQDPYTFTVALSQTPSENVATGIVEFYVNNWTNSHLKCGLFDDQNGLYFEYDGQVLYCVRKSSTLQLSGTCALTFNSGKVIGTNTKFASQVSAGDKIVLKGQTYLVSKVASNSEMYILPSYRGTSSDQSVITKTIETKIPQSQWSLDPCDGTGSTGYVLNIHRIQMAYMDYSWYGAGKVRFGFKDQNGKVIYVHEFIHNNKQTEAYMRSGNLPARYEIENTGTPSYVPALAHWGTSVIMDGQFNDDKAYVFTASSDQLAITGTASVSVQARVEFTGFPQGYYQVRQQNQWRNAGYALLIQTPSASYNNISTNRSITGTGISSPTFTRQPADGRLGSLPYLPSVETRATNDDLTIATRSLLIIDRTPTIVAGGFSAYSVSIASAATAVVYDQPLISIRLAPSVDNGTPGYLGQREILNRMQLILDSVGILTTHTCEVKLILNGSLNNYSWERVTVPSLSQLVYHSTQDRIIGGTTIYTFRAQGGTGTTNRVPSNNVVNLNELATLGNSVLGGDGVFPDGPDVLTVVVSLIEDPSTVSTSNPFSVGGRVGWSESQA
jgi:hypothetical protein